MADSHLELWQQFQQHYTEFPTIRLALDLSRMDLSQDAFNLLEPLMRRAFASMADLERGALANPDEKRMVGHYWLRNPALAPSPVIRREIEETIQSIKSFAAGVHAGNIKSSADGFKNILLIGIGGSALGPQFVSAALGEPATDKMTMYFLDNTDPDGIDMTLSSIGKGLLQTLCIVVSKSGGTKETRNGMLETQAAFRTAGLDFSKSAVAITSRDSQLDKQAACEGWLARFPMWDWVGGRTSELSAVGLLPAALQGFNVDELLAGAKACDDVTRVPSFKVNPSAQLAAAWYIIGRGKGEKNMVVLPYKDRLALFSKYLQQLLMESLGKALDLDGNEVHQGITVLGNKGSTDQHSYIQQLRDGLNNFFVVFIEVLRERRKPLVFVEPDITSGDYLEAFFLGTRGALYENGRKSISITITDVTPFTVGALIALFERAVGFYASLININAYHQPGVEAGKKAAYSVLELQKGLLNELRALPQTRTSAKELARRLGQGAEAETIFKICEHLAANPERRIHRVAGANAAETEYWFEG